MMGIATPAELLQLERRANDAAGQEYLDKDETVADLLAEADAKKRAVLSAETFGEELRFVYAIRDEGFPLWKRQVRQWERLWGYFDKEIADRKERVKVRCVTQHGSGGWLSWYATRVLQRANARHSALVAALEALAIRSSLLAAEQEWLRRRREHADRVLTTAKRVCSLRSWHACVHLQEMCYHRTSRRSRRPQASSSVYSTGRPSSCGRLCRTQTRGVQNWRRNAQLSPSYLRVMAGRVRRAPLRTRRCVFAQRIRRMAPCTYSHRMRGTATCCARTQVARTTAKYGDASAEFVRAMRDSNGDERAEPVRRAKAKTDAGAYTAALFLIAFSSSRFGRLQRSQTGLQTRSQQPMLDRRSR
jgi:hypothetical protein